MNDPMKALRELAEKWRGEYQEFPPGTQEHGLYAGTLWCADELDAALAAMGGQGECETCEGVGYVINYVDPYGRGDASSPYREDCPDCAHHPEAQQPEAVACLHDWATDGMGDFCRHCGRREESYTSNRPTAPAPKEGDNG